MNKQLSNGEAGRPLTCSALDRRHLRALHPVVRLPPVLDVCCGSRMFWFDRHDRRAIYLDKRRETLTADNRPGRRCVVVDPDMLGDFTALPFPDNTFACVIFDPPHFARNGKRSWMAKKYGTLKGNWREELHLGFAECFRVLKPHGTLIFKWNEGEVAIPEILALTPERPLVGNRYGKHFQSHWIVFLKPNGRDQRPGPRDA